MRLIPISCWAIGWLTVPLWGPFYFQATGFEYPRKFLDKKLSEAKRPKVRKVRKGKKNPNVDTDLDLEIARMKDLENKLEGILYKHE